MNYNNYLDEGYSIALFLDEKLIFSSRRKNLSPLFEVLENGVATENAVAVDKIVGKAAAFLYSLMRISSLHADVLSEKAIPILKENCISFTYRTLTKEIISRNGKDICPMEKAISSISSPEEAYLILYAESNKIRKNAMQYRQLQHGNDDEKLSVLGLGMGGIQNCTDKEITKIIEKAIASGINCFDMCCAAKNVFRPFGRAIKGQRKKVYLQIHFGAIYNENGEYGRTRDLNEIKKTVNWILSELNTDYIDFGYLHCVDDFEDYQMLLDNGIFDYIKELKDKGIVRHIGFSSHTPLIAQKIIDSGLIDMFMFSVNAAYDFDKNDEYGLGTRDEREKLYQRCEKEGIGISVMKPFSCGQLLDEKLSPFHKAMTKYQCLQYALDRPAVLTALPGIRGLSDLNELLYFVNCSEIERNYSIIATFSGESVKGRCVYCNHCQPCPKGIDVALVNKYYDLAKIGDKLAYDHYKKLKINADSCIGCGHCNKNCPFEVLQMEKMREISEYFSK